jgi:IS5 family transposase
MQTKREIRQAEMMLLPSMEERIPESYYLRRLNRVLDLSFVHEAVRDKYCQDNGRPSIDPEVILRLALLQAITGRDSVRGLLEEVDLHLGYRWFIGYGPSEPLPDHSTLSKALARFGDEVFNELFERSIQQCQASGLIGGKVLHVDATTIRADLDANRVNQPDSPDKDARFGRFPDGTLKPGYKQHTVVDGKKGVVLGVSVSPANKPDDTGMVGMVDEVTERLGQAPEVVCADAAYGSGRNRAALEKRGVRLVSPPAKPITYTGDKYFTVAAFEYDEGRDEFVCPAGERLVFIGNDAARPDRRRYRAEGSPCKVCRLKVRCTGSSRRELKVGTHHAALIRLRADSKTESFRSFYRSRAPVIEGTFAEGKQWHGLRRARRRGLCNMLVQSLIVATVLNLKRLATLLPLLSGLKWLWNRLQTLIESYLRLMGLFAEYSQLISPYA